MRQKRPLSLHHELSSLFFLILLFGSCRTMEETGAQTMPGVEHSAYQIQMRSQGFVELVGDDQIAPAALPPHPSQADLGAEPYRQICLACHGDWGQGLTEAWRSEWDEDKNCWQSKCHATNHPPWGFDFPQTVPAVLGPESLSRFSTAQSLYENIQNSMPWWNPGSLSTDDAWTLTAYLMRERGEFGDDAELNPGNAAIYRLHVPYAANDTGQLGIIALIGFLTLIILALVRK
jgi:mono/diheme cytochrome c family protein